MKLGARSGFVLGGLLCLAVGTRPSIAEEYSFDASEFEKKPFELGGYLQLKQEGLQLNTSRALYRLAYYQQPPRDSLDRTTGTLELGGKLRHGDATFDFRTNSFASHDQLTDADDNKIHEAALSLRPDPGLTLEAGKRTLRWGKGYVWNPLAFVERPKDPNDPDLGREGFVMLDADLIVQGAGPLKTIAFTPVLVPTSDELNRDFGPAGHLNPAAKLYLLLGDTDIDFAWQGRGSRTARFGVDFAHNLSSNFAIHGEWARIRGFVKPIVARTGAVDSFRADASSHLLGLRYLTEGDTTYIAEYYRNGTGYSEQEASQFYAFANDALESGNSLLMQKALTLYQSSYGRPYAGQRYFYLRIQQKDAFGIVYFQPAITLIMNADDRSYQLTPELLYTGFKDLEFRLRLAVLEGDDSTDFGEKQVSKRLELHARYYF